MPSFSVLGPLRAWRQGHQLALGTPQQRVVLALLLLRRGEVVPVEDLIRAVWDEHPPRGADGTIRTYVSRLRRALDTVGIAGRAGGYAIQVPAHDLDLAVFGDLLTSARAHRRAGRDREALDGLRAAAGLWTGPPLPGLPGAYLQARRSMLEELKYAADLERLELAVELEPGRTDPAEPAALVEARPLDERPRELLILALAGAGRRAEALAAFAAARQVLAARLGVDPGPGLVRAHRQVFTGPGGVVPAQLPPDLTDFAGRTALLAQLAAATGSATGTAAARATTGTVSARAAPGAAVPGAASADGAAAGSGPVVGLYGAPGVGTSSVAIRAAHRLRAGFPDGQLYADLRSADLDTVLAGFLRAYGISGSGMPTARADRIALWRRCLAGRRVLVLLDQVTGAEQVEALRASLTLITAHDRPAGMPAAQWIEVPPFAFDEGAELLERIAGAGRIRAEPAAARRLVAAAEGRPLRVRMAAARIASRPQWTVSATADRVRDQPPAVVHRPLGACPRPG